MAQYTKDAQVVWKMLNGIFVLYKPVNVPVVVSRDTICQNLCKDLNAMKVRPPEPYVLIEGETNNKLSVSVRSSYADNILVVGPRYQAQDIRMSFANILQTDSSGVMVCAINEGNKIAHHMKHSAPTRSYRLKGILGKATDNFFVTGKVMEKTTYKFLNRSHIDRVCASMQSSHQRKMFELSGIDIQSQAAYELAVKGLIRPADSKIPILYSIKCVDFNSPEFTLEIVCINEDEMYLKGLIHELGLELRSTATCSQVHCIRFGLFNLEHALLSKYWNLENILNNIELCDKIVSENRFLLKQENVNLIDQDNVSLIESQ